MSAQIHVLKLTQDPFDLDTLPMAEKRNIVTIAYEPDTMSLPFLSSVVLFMLTHVGMSLDKGDDIYIVMKPTPRAVAAALMLWAAFFQVGIEPHIWVLEKSGIYVSVREFVVLSTTWATQLKEKWRFQEITRTINDQAIRIKDGKPE